MLKRALTLIVLALLAAGLAPAALAQGDPVLVVENRLPQSIDTKRPRVDTLGASAYVSGNPESQVRLWSKPDAGTSWPSPLSLGDAPGKPDFSTTSLFVTDDGMIHVVWTIAEDRRIYLRSKGPADADFGPRRTVLTTSPFPVEPEVAANEDGVFVFWREPKSSIKYRRSTNGVDWDGTIVDLFDGTAEQYMEVAAGSGRRMVIGYTAGQDDKLQVWTGIWNGSGFAIQRIPAPTDRDFANPSVSLKPDGGYFAAFRSEDPAVAGVYFSERGATGEWGAPGRLSPRGKTYSAAADVDKQGNVHLYWIAEPSGSPMLYYAWRRAGQKDFQGPKDINPGSQPLFNLHAAANLTGNRSFGHAISERFEGEDLFGQYFLFALPVVVVDATGISIEGGAAYTNKAAVSVAFSGVTGAPDKVRYSWGAPPTASSPTTPFAAASPAVTLALPQDANPSCATQTLYTQLISGTVAQITPSTDTIVLDRAVQADFSVAGPAPALDPRYTGSLNAVATVFSGFDCAGLATASLTGPVAGGSLSLPVLGQPTFTQAVTLTGDPAVPGVKELGFFATDLTGNATPAVVTRTLIYDPVPPSLTGVLSVTEDTLVPNPRGTTQIRMAIQGLVASDPGGVLAGIDLTISNPNLKASSPGRISFSTMDQVVTNADGSLTLRDTIDLTDFFAPADLVPGVYSFVVRIVDGAGNPSPTSQSVTLSENLATITYPAFVPFARR